MTPRSASSRTECQGKGRLARKADNLNAICEPYLQTVGASASRKPMGLHGLLWGQLYLPFPTIWIYSQFNQNVIYRLFEHVTLI
jgi:hypothetical protein